MARRHLFAEQGNGVVIVVRVAALSVKRVCRMSLRGGDPGPQQTDLEPLEVHEHEQQIEQALSSVRQ